MNNWGKRVKTDNAFFELKCELRRNAIAGLDEVSVLDCFAGTNRIWKNVGFDKYLGIEKVKGKGTLNLYGDNLRIIPALDLSGFTVIDVDSYGIPASQIEAVVKNKTCPAKLLVFFTAIGGAIAGATKNMYEQLGIKKRVYDKCQMLWNKHMIELFYNFLNQIIGVEEVVVHRIQDGAYMKHYGFFELTRK